METFKANNSKIPYSVDYRNVKYPRLEFKTGDLLLILPKDGFDETTTMDKHSGWIQKKDAEIKNALKIASKKKLELNRTENAFKKLVLNYSEGVNSEYSFNFNKISFKKMKSKWGSCSPQKTITVNTLLKYLPQKLIEYVVFHELAHSIEKKHNSKFWKIVGKKFKNYKNLENQLLIHWFLIQKTVMK